MFDDKRALLEGTRVLDASRVLAGPFCGQMLGDLGAEVIKIEKPGAGDETRSWGPPFLSLPGGPAFSAYYLSCNRNKRGTCLDLAQPEGRELFERCSGGAMCCLRISERTVPRSSGCCPPVCGRSIRGSSFVRYPASAAPAPCASFPATTSPSRR